MSRSPRLKVLAVAASVTLLAFALSGCSLVNKVKTLEKQAISVIAKPTVGECWKVGYDDYMNSEDWPGGPTVSCATPHQSYTFAVTIVPGDYTGSWADSKGYVKADIDTAAAGACQDQENLDFPDVDGSTLVQPGYFLPYVSQWQRGARWVRCDIAVLALGSLVSSPTLADLPTPFSKVTDEYGSHDKKLAVCENDPANKGPDGAKTSYADCTGAPDWTLVKELSVPGDESAPWPGADKLHGLGKAKCATLDLPKGRTVFVELPDKSDWTDYDDRTLDCWISRN